MQIEGSVVVVTGGGSGIGAECAKELAKAGAKVVVAGRRQDVLDDVVEAITADGGDAIGVSTDICDEESVGRLMDAAIEKYGMLNIVFANAGAIADSLMLIPDKTTGKVAKMMSLDRFKRVIDTNLVGTFLTLREGARRIVDGGWPGLLLITSSINATGQVGQLNYSSTKAALNIWPKVLSGEFNMRGVNLRVAGVAPGYTATDILMGMNKETLNAILKDVHIHRLVKTEEIAAALMHIIENDAIDGTIVEVTGGLTYGPYSRVK